MMTAWEHCHSPHPTDPERWCIYDGPHEGLDHADGLGSWTAADYPSNTPEDVDGIPCQYCGGPTTPEIDMEAPQDENVRPEWFAWCEDCSDATYRTAVSA